MNTDLILSIATLVLGGCNIFQFIWWRSEKQKHQAEADSASIDAAQKKQDLQQDQYDFFMDKVAKFQNDYMEISEQLRQESRRHIEEITQTEQKYQEIILDKQSEIQDIKRQLNYFKKIRCYREDCKNRIQDLKENADNKATATGCDAECKAARRHVCPDSK